MSATWKHINKVLEDSSTVRRNIYAFNVPQQIKPPYVVFFLEDTEVLHTMDQANYTKLETWSIQSSDVSVKDAIDNADAIVTLFNYYSATEESVTVKQSIWINRSIPLIDADQDDKIYTVIDTFEFRI